MEIQEINKTTEINKIQEIQLESKKQFVYTVYSTTESGSKLLDKAIQDNILIEYLEPKEPKELKETRELRELEQLQELQSPDRYIYTVYSKDLSGVTLLNKAFKDEYSAYSYAISKITNLLEIITLEFLDTEDRVMPLDCGIIYAHYRLKHNNIEKYDYFKTHYKRFFYFASRDPIMFFVSTLLLV